MDIDKKILIAPSILSADMAHLADEIKAIESAGADWVHVDVMDGRFVPNITIGIPVVASIKPCTKLPLDVHLMILEPERYIQQFAEAGATHISFHTEATQHVYSTLKAVRNAGCKSGVALCPATPIQILENILETIDFIVIMTVEPGFGGQKFIPEMLQKIKAVRRLIEKHSLPVDIQVDGGIKKDTIGPVVRAGGNVFVSGSGVFNSVGPTESIRALREAAKSY